MESYALLIDGRSVATAEHREVINPSTGETVGLLPLASPADLDAAVAAAARAFKPWAAKSDAERAQALRDCADAMKATPRSWPAC